MRPRATVLLLTTIIIACAISVFPQEPCPALPPPTAPPPHCPEVNDIHQKIDLWRFGTCLRGANFWQKRVVPDDEMGPGPVGPPYDEPDIRKLFDWGANYVNISHPGIFAEKPNARGEYYEQPGVFDNLMRLISLCRDKNLFVVVSFRTGPERSEYVFDKKERPKYTGVWKSKKAQKAWADMWALTASRLRNQPNVVGYDLMVEPGISDTEGEHRETWNRMAEDIRLAIRRADGGNDQMTPILIGPSGASAVASLEEAVPAADPRTVYTVHQYVPDDYAQPEGGPPIPYPGGISQMAPDLQALYGRIADFKRSHGNVPVAVNEFGAFRNASRAECYVGLQTELLERLGSNYAIWLWETSWPLSYDEFNFRFGTDPTHHAEVESSELIRVIKAAWSKNRPDLSRAMSNFGTP